MLQLGCSGSGATMLRPVDPGGIPLTDDELQKRGNELVSAAREAAITAIGKSMHPEFVQRGHNLQRRDILRWRHKVRDSIAAWREAEGHLTELLNELDKKDAQFRATHEPKVVSEDGVHYVTRWVKKGEEES